jgi:hypothetical protein
VKAFQLKCGLCGHEFATVEAPVSVQRLVDRLSEQSASGGHSAQTQADTIRNWPIPVSTGDLLEFATFAGSNALVGVGKANPISDAWRAKALEAVAKGRLAFRESDPGFAAIRELEQRLATDQKTRVAVGATRGVAKGLLIAGGIAALLFLALLGAVMSM